MRLIATAFVILSSLAQGLQSEEAKLTDSHSKQTYLVECRFIGEKGQVLSAPRIKLIDGQNAFVSDLWQTPMVNAVVLKNGVRSGNVQVLKEGTMVEVTVLGQPDQKVAVDATVEASKIGPIGVKNGLQTASVDSQKRRVLDLVSLGETLVIPMGQKGNAKSTPRVELLVSAATK
jgi:hypothetical protein